MDLLIGLYVALNFGFFIYYTQTVDEFIVTLSKEIRVKHLIVGLITFPSVTVMLILVSIIYLVHYVIVIPFKYVVRNYSNFLNKPIIVFKKKEK